MSMPTFYVEEGISEQSRIVLSGKEAWHALGVRRLGVGDRIRLIDGRGHMSVASVESLQGRNEAILTLAEVCYIKPPRPTITLATAIAKGDRQSTMLDMATQLGMHAWQPLLCQRSVSKIGKNSYQRWQKICLEACKQSGSAWLPELLPAAKPADVARAACANGSDVLLAHPGGQPLSADNTTDKVILVGPEGGFTDEELAAILAAGARKLDLGRNILRIETAAVSLIARLGQALPGSES